MRIVALEDQQYAYLRHVLEQHSMGGLPANELPIAGEVYIRVISATEVPKEALNLGKAKVAEVGPNGIALEVEPPAGTGAARRPKGTDECLRYGESSYAL
jgi:hypothetical protein